MPSFRPVPDMSGVMSARSTLIASPAVLPEPLTTLLSIATVASCTSWFRDFGPCTMPRMFGMCLAFSFDTTEATAAESAGDSFPPPGRENTMIAASAVTFEARGNAWFSSAWARIDS
jgi:hypothetical protein